MKNHEYCNRIMVCPIFRATVVEEEDELQLIQDTEPKILNTILPTNVFLTC